VNLAIAGVIAAFAAGVYGFHTDNAPLMVVAFLAFGAALGCADWASGRFNNHAHDSLELYGRSRVGYYEDEEAA
jgi:hypothetical protein